MKKKQTKKFETKFDKLLSEAFEDDFLTSDEEGPMDEYEDEISPVEGEEGEEGGEDVTITLTSDQVAVLKDVLSQLDTEEYSDEEENTFEGGDEEGEEDISDIEELEKESSEVYSKHGLAETAPDAETVRNTTKKGKAADNTGELERDSTKEDGHEKQYKFVKRGKNKSGEVENPEPKKYKQVSASKAKPDEPKY